MNRRLGFGLGILVGWTLSVSAQAHGIVLKARPSGQAWIIEAAYDSGDPLALAEIKIFPPNTPSPYQAGQTDLKGKFAFVPDGPGPWKIVVDDKNGHRLEKTLQISPAFAPPAKSLPADPAGPPGRWDRLVMGICLIIGAMGLALWWKARVITRLV